MQNSFYAAINHVADLSGNKCDILERSTGHTPGSLLADFNPFCLFLLLDDRYDKIDGTVKHNCKFGFSLHVIEKPYNNRKFLFTDHCPLARITVDHSSCYNAYLKCHKFFQPISIEVLLKHFLSLLVGREEFL